MSQDEFTDWVAFFSWLFATYAVGVKIVLLAYYVMSEYWRLLIPRMLIGVSHVMLLILTVMSLNFRIFVGGASRFYGSIVALMAFGLGAIGMSMLISRERISDLHATADPSGLMKKK
jgi:hypothetical protein